MQCGRGEEKHWAGLKTSCFGFLTFILIVGGDVHKKKWFSLKEKWI